MNFLGLVHKSTGSLAILLFGFELKGKTFSFELGHKLHYSHWL